MAVDPKVKSSAAPADGYDEAVRALTGALGSPSPQPAAAAPGAANDDRATIGSILQSLQMRPRLSAYGVAGIGSGLWLVAAALIGWSFGGDLRALLSVGGAAIPVLLGLGALLLLPVTSFFLVAHMSSRAQEMRLISQSMAKVAISLGDPTLAARQTAIAASQVATMNQGVERALALAAELEGKIRNELSGLERAHQDSEERIRGMAQSLAHQNAKIAAQTEQVRKAIAAGREYSEKVLEVTRASIDGFAARFDEKAAQLTSGLDQRLSLFQSAVDNRSRAVDETLTTRTDSMIKVIAESGKDLTAALDRRVTDVKVILDSRGSAVSEILTSKIQELDKTIEHRLSAVTRHLDAQIADFEDFASGRAKAATSEIATQSIAAAETITAHLERMAQTINSHLSDATGLIDTRGKATADALHASMTRIATTIETKGADARQSLAATAEDVETRLATAAANAAALMSQDAREAERVLREAGTETSRGVIDNAERMTVALRDSGAAITALLDSKGGSLISALALQGDDLAAALGRTADQAVQNLQAHAQTFAVAVTENGERIASDIAATTQAATEAMGNSLKGVEESAQIAIARAQQATSTSLSEIRQVHDMLRSDANILYDRLREANLLLREALAGSQDNIGTLEKALGQRVTDFIQTMKIVSEQSGTAAGQMSQHIHSFQQAAIRVVDDLADIGIQFESHGHSLMQAVDLIDNINTRTMEAVNDRSVALDRLISALDVRAVDFEQRLLRFSAILDESLDSAATRTREIASLIAESSTQGVRAIGEQYNLVRNTVEEEQQRLTESLQAMHERTVGEQQRQAESLRTMHERTVGESQTMLQQATERFTELLQGVRRMAGDMQKELEATRTEMRQGIAEIPRDTTEGLRQLRQVVLDQVEALTELQRVAAAHGRGVDVSDPRRPEREDPLGQFVVGKGRTSLRKIESEVSALRKRTDNAEPPTGNSRATWLSDLLQRASRKDEGAPSASNGRGASGAADNVTVPKLGSLDALSADIGEMIDHDTAVELWDRYNRGERNVFNRRLYTKRGLKTFDDVRERYRSDPQFKRTADRYMSEFERMLEDVSSDDRGHAMVRTYLTSETGKVYTLLAHAAGRFD